MLILNLSTAPYSFSMSKEEPKKAKILETLLRPTGYGLTKFLNRDYYLARFSIDESIQYGNADDLIYINAARRMEFKFLSKQSLSGKTFWRRLSQGMKINNERKALKDNLFFFKKLKTFFTHEIKRGDIIRFDYHPDLGTYVFYNHQLLGEINQSREFYRFILNVWLGRRPPSKRFKQGLLGKNGDNYAIRMQEKFIEF
jgi:hypothetical protein